MNFDYDFWVRKLKELNYPLKTLPLHIETLRETQTLPNDVSSLKITKLTDEKYVEVAIIEFDRNGGQLTRSRCTWIDREKILLFSDGDSRLVTTMGSTGETRMAWQRNGENLMAHILWRESHQQQPNHYQDKFEALWDDSHPLQRVWPSRDCQGG